MTCRKVEWLLGTQKKLQEKDRDSKCPKEVSGTIEKVLETKRYQKGYPVVEVVANTSWEDPWLKYDSKVMTVTRSWWPKLKQDSKWWPRLEINDRSWNKTRSDDQDSRSMTGIKKTWNRMTSAKEGVSRRREVTSRVLGEWRHTKSGREKDDVK